VSKMDKVLRSFIERFIKPVCVPESKMKEIIKMYDQLPPQPAEEKGPPVWTKKQMDGRSGESMS